MPCCAGPHGEAPGLGRQKVGGGGRWGGGWTKAFSGFSPRKGKARQSKQLRLASVNDSDDLWATGVVSGCLVPGH